MTTTTIPNLVTGLSSDGGNHNRCRLAAPAPVQAMRKVPDDEDERENDKQRFAKAFGQLAHHPAERMAEDVTRGDEDRGPKTRRNEIEDQEAAPMDVADAERERRKVTHA